MYHNTKLELIFFLNLTVESLRWRSVNACIARSYTLHWKLQHATTCKVAFPQTLLTTVNAKSLSLKTPSPLPQSCFHSGHFTATTSPTASPQPYFRAVSWQISSTLPRIPRTCEERGGPMPSESAQTHDPRSQGTPPAPLLRGPQPPLRSPLPASGCLRAQPGGPPPRSGSPVGNPPTHPRLRRAASPARPPAALTPVSERWGGAWESPS